MSRYKKMIPALMFIAGMTSNGTAQSALFDRGGGLIYDNVLNATWLQDANYAQTSGYAASHANGNTIYSDGKMDWWSAQSWASQLIYHDSVRNQDITGWRLPTTNPVAGGSIFNYNWTFNGSTDSGWNITSPQSELAYMFYVNLLNSGDTTTTGSRNWGWTGIASAAFQDATQNSNAVDLFSNLQSSGYWSGSEWNEGHSANPSNAWYLDFSTGYQGDNVKYHTVYAWAVHDGDIALTAVPVPGAVWLFSGGLGMLTLSRRRKK